MAYEKPNEQAEKPARETIYVDPAKAIEMLTAGNTTDVQEVAQPARVAVADFAKGAKTGLDDFFAQ